MTIARLRSTTRLALSGLLSAAVVTGIPTGPAEAVPPEVVDDVTFEGTPELDQYFTDYCGFPVTVATTGHFRGTAFFDSEGNFREFTGHPSMVETFASPYSSFESSDRGLDKYTLDADGNLLLFGTGIHLKIDGQIYAIGLWRITIDLATDEVVAAEYHGNFDVVRPEIDDAICTLLGPPAR